MGLVDKKKLIMDSEQQPLLDRHFGVHAMEDIGSKIRIERSVCIQSTEVLVKDGDKAKCLKVNCNPKEVIKSMFPAISWVIDYQWQEWLVKDLISGITVAVMNIPQGMAYALLGNVPPVVGIYMGLFPVLVYAVLGTSRHVSMGSFAVICLMTGNVVSQHSNHDPEMNGPATNDPDMRIYTPIQVGSAVAFLVGIYQLLLYVFRFGHLCTLLSETLVSGFTAGAAIHVFTSQLKDVFGIKVGKHNGPLKLIYIYGDLFSRIHTTNLAAVVLSAITAVVLIANNEILKPFVAKRCIIPVPIELIVVLCGTLASTYGGVAATYGLKVVGDIPVGLPEPILPEFDLFPAIAISSLVIAIIAYVVSLSMALIFANKLKYEIDPNQELFAQGWGNVVGSLFSCLPYSASLSRSAIQESVGGCTQLASVFSALILTFVLLWIAPFFELLPRCILAILIIVALKGILFQAADIIEIWKVSSVDATIWSITYLSVIIIDIDYGLLAGVVTSIIIIFIKGNQLRVTVLERLSNTEIFLEPDLFSKTERIPGLTVISYTGCINFVNKTMFKNRSLEIVQGNPDCPTSKVVRPEEQRKETVIMDFRSVSYIDSSGANALKLLFSEFGNIDRSVLMVGLKGPSIEMLQTCKVLTSTSEPIFPTIQDAVTYSQFKLAPSSYNVRL